MLRTLFTFFLRWAVAALVVYWVILFSLTHWPHLSVPIHLHGVIEFDKCCHTIAFAGLAILLMIVRPFQRKLGWHGSVTLAAVIALAYAAFDESTQGLFHRDPTFADFTADAIAILSVYLVVAADRGLTLRRPGVIIPARVACGLVIPALLFVVFAPIGRHWLASVYQTNHIGLHAQQTIHFILPLVLLVLIACAAPGGRDRPRVGRVITIVVVALGVAAVGIMLRHQHLPFDSRTLWAHELGVLAGLAAWSIFTAMRPWLARRPAISQRAATVKERS